LSTLRADEWVKSIQGKRDWDEDEAVEARVPCWRACSTSTCVMSSAQFMAREERES